ncbi:tRNA-binding protein [Sphingomonas oligophenolica]|uniref:tRNA-binding protein n=1 Tax=Sphingomonas oligophenolica TaxID=301154 RepID=A0ABU9Y0J3_9SPHN
MKNTADFDSFSSLDIRVGTILSAEPAHTKKATYKMEIDFGPEIGRKISCGAYTNYDAAYLIGKQIIGVVNFAPRKMGPETSEVLVLGVASKDQAGTVFLTVGDPVENGNEVF